MPRPSVSTARRWLNGAAVANCPRVPAYCCWRPGWCCEARAPVGAAAIAGVVTPAQFPILSLGLLGGVLVTIMLLACYRARLAR